MEKKFNYVYLTTNLINGKQYVGDRSVNKLPDVYLGSGKYYKNAETLYGKENFKKEILEFFNTKQEAFNAQEKYIKLYRTHISSGGYNISEKGGYGVSGSFLDEETKNKIRFKLLGIKHTEERNKNQRESLKGKVIIPWNKGKKTGELSKQHKENISKNSIGKHKVSAEHKQKLIEYNTGRKLSEETKKKISDKQRKIFKICPHCNNGITYREYYRGHENKCKKENKI